MHLLSKDIFDIFCRIVAFYQVDQLVFEELVRERFPKLGLYIAILHPSFLCMIFVGWLLMSS